VCTTGFVPMVWASGGSIPSSTLPSHSLTSTSGALSSPLTSTSGAPSSRIPQSQATTLPFTDVPESDSLYAPLLRLYRASIIRPSANNLFEPDRLINRDDFVSIVLGANCRECLTPSPQDIIDFPTPPFVDVELPNPNYYCIAVGKRDGIIE
jgi:hypothetical protein